MNTEKLLYSFKEVGDLIGKYPYQVYPLIYSGILPAMRIGSLKVARDDLLRFIAKYKGMDISDPDNIKPLLSDTDFKPSF